MHIHTVTPATYQESLACSLRTLRAGGLVVYPTETTYGIGVDVQNPRAVEKLLSYKGKRTNNPLSVAVSDKTMASKYVQINSVAADVYARFLPGPVTVVSTGTGSTAPGIASLQGTVGIRIPKHDLALDLITQFGSGISATGANASKKKRPYTIKDIFDNTSAHQQSLIDCILDVGELPHNDPSTVIDTTMDDITTLREGRVQFDSDHVVTTNSESETIEFFDSFTRRFRSQYTYKPVLFMFSGQMGAGKTHAIKGIAQGLSITDPVVSPTYVTASEYEITNESRPGLFVHMDCWRMNGFAQVKDVGFEQYVEKNAVIAIEWADRFRSDFLSYRDSAQLIWIDIQVDGENTRKIQYSIENCKIAKLKII